MRPYLTFWISICILICLVSFSGCHRAAIHSQPMRAKQDEAKDQVQLSQGAIQHIGLTLVHPQMTMGGDQLNTTGEIKANENNLFHINSFSSGRVLEDHVYLGQIIHQGEVLAQVQNIEVSKINADYIHQLHQNEVDIRLAKTRLDLAQKNYDREKKLFALGISPQKDYINAAGDLKLQTAQLQGLQEHNTHLTAEAKALMSAYGNRLGNPRSEHLAIASPIIAPHGGLVTKKTITVGDMVSPAQVLYEIMDLSKVWLNIIIYPSDLDKIKLGQKVLFTSDSLPGTIFHGQIDYIQPMSQDMSQTFLARAFIHNPGLELKPGMFGQVSIQIKPPQQVMALPRDAVQQYDQSRYVFKDLGHGRFQKIPVLITGQDTEHYFIQASLVPSDSIVSKGSFTLKAELLKDQLRDED